VEPIKLGICGLGTVGRGTVEVLERNAASIARRVGAAIEVAHVGSRQSLPQLRAAGVQISADHLAVARDPQVDILVETIGGTTLARRLVEEAIAQGKHVVTANKALLAEHGNALFAAAAAQGVQIAYEAAVAGGIPIVHALSTGLAANRINLVAGIINGTGNFILTEMRDKGQTFAAALAAAQARGYAEADPAFDIEGTDAAHKLAILAALAFGIPLQFDCVFTEGLTELDPQDVQHAAALGYAIKHLGIARRTAAGIELRVHPTLVPREQPIAQVDGVMNAVLVNADASGPTLYCGAGAGGDPTASAVLADVVDLARLVVSTRGDKNSGKNGKGVPAARVPACLSDPPATVPVLNIADCTTAFYLRFDAKDQAGVLSRITGLFSDAGLSVEAIQQREPTAGSQEATIIMITQRAREWELRRLVQALQGLDALTSRVVVIRVEDLNCAESPDEHAQSEEA